MIFAVFNIIMSGTILIDLFLTYIDDFDTFLHARATPECVVDLIIGMILSIFAFRSNRRIADSNFYSGYFEGSLDGVIKYSELAEVTGKKEKKLRKQLRILSKHYMKNYELTSVDGTEQITLNSKKIKCQCKSCGAEIEKSMYFTGTCEYCGSSDLYAGVLTNDRYYSITHNVSEGIHKPDYYSSKHIKLKKAIFIILLSLSACMILIFSLYTVDCIGNYNNKEYLQKAILAPETQVRSFKAIKQDLMEGIVLGAAIVVAFTPLALNRIRKIRSINSAILFSSFFSRAKVPFIQKKELLSVNTYTDNDKKLRNVRTAIRNGYLRNSTLEKHGDELVVALAKKIVKDRCPSCSAPVTGAVDEHYRCQYCDNLIMNVIIKK
jgi:Zn finger protein HypA/HybF involved in hydrogenase expression